jgi:hypothetical protein
MAKSQRQWRSSAWRKINGGERKQRIINGIKHRGEMAAAAGLSGGGRRNVA